MTPEQRAADDAKWAALRAELSEPGSRTIFEGSAPLGRAVKLYDGDGRFVIDGNEGETYEDADTAKLGENQVHYESLWSSPDLDDPERRAVARLRVPRGAE